MLLMCGVFFLLPFALRGARLSLGELQNNVADWLPQDYPETQDLNEFRKYFYGDQFVVLSGPWCKEGNTTFEQLKESIRRESLAYEADLKAAGNQEELAAHRKGDELGLLYTGDYHQDWGEHNEKWLQGRNGKWYFIDRQGRLFRWEGQNNIVEGAKRFLERTANGKNKSHGTYVATFGPPPDGQNENPFYQNPEKLCCRPFKSVITGPDVFDQMAGPDGTLRIGKFNEEDLSTFEAKIEAHKRLTGALFGPTPPRSFNWTFDSLLQHVEPAQQAILTADPAYRSAFGAFVERELEEKYDGEMDRLVHAHHADQLEAWYRAWYQLELSPPPRQTCMIVTLNEPIIDELARAMGRSLMGKPRGRLLELAVGKCGISSDNVHMGGPPVDNVAIDEEGTNTLVRLAGLSLLIGMSLAYLSFGSIRVAIMLFFVGGVAAIASLSYVWFAGQTMDAILMTMPSLVYVMGLSSAVHIVNYYRDACHEFGPRRAVEIAINHSWFPCTLAAFTTALGLISLTTSNLRPIYKFGLFSAIASVATLTLLFTYLPSALTIWKPGYKRRPKGELPSQTGLTAWVGRTWDSIGGFIVNHYGAVAVTAILLMVCFAVGLTKVKTTVQLLKLFDSDAKILHDYRWMEENLGELVPAEIVLWVDRDWQKEPYVAEISETQKSAALAKLPAGSDPSEVDDLIIDYNQNELDLKYSMLERVEMSSRVRQQLERFFGPDGLGIVGSGMSTDVFTPLYRLDSQVDSLIRRQFSASLFAKRGEMLEQDYLAEVNEKNINGISAIGKPISPEEVDALGREMWRISIRLAALNDVDYGRFVNDLKRVVEPILNAYRSRTEILKSLQTELGDEASKQSRVLVLGRNPDFHSEEVLANVNASTSLADVIDQTFIFSDTLQDLLENRSIADVQDKEKPNAKKYYVWFDPVRNGLAAPELTDKQIEQRKKFLQPESFAQFVQQFDCVVLIENDPHLDLDLIATNAKQFVDCRDHRFEVDPRTNLPMAGMLTAMDKQDAGADLDVTSIYTGIVPIVYKAQRSLLTSLIQSIGLSFLMISLVMMVLLRDWGSPTRFGNLINFRGGLIAMIPNIFPVVIVFGFMGLRGIRVDIGSMMTASVAMGIAVDDTIHFLNWYRLSLAEGRSRIASIRDAYSRVATAMTQTTLIAGLGLAAFALSTFTPTQRFGVLMLFLLMTALVGDLILLPALLASPLGRYFGKEKSAADLNENEIGSPLLDAASPAPLRIVGSSKPEVILPDDSSHDRETKRLL